MGPQPLLCLALMLIAYGACGDSADMDCGAVACAEVSGDVTGDPGPVTPPEAPRFAETEPTSPGQSSTPRIRGTASPASNLSLHAAADCGDPPLGEGVTEVDGAFDVEVTVAPNTTTSIFGRATAPNGPASDCVWLTDYVHDDVGPPLSAGAPEPGDSDESAVTFTWRGSAEPSATVGLAVGPTSEGLCDAIGQVHTRASADGAWALSGAHAVDAVSFYALRAADEAGNLSACLGPTPLVGSATVEVSAESGPLVGGVEVFSSRHDGRPLHRSVTTAGGALEVLVYPGAALTVVGQDEQGHWLQTHMDVRPTALLEFGQPMSGADTPRWVGDIEVILPGAFPGATDYALRASCEIHRVTSSSVSIFFSVTDDCRSVGEAVDMVVVARDGEGAPLAFTTVTQLVLSSGYNPAVPPPWRQDFDEVRVQLQAGSQPIAATVELAAVRQGTAFGLTPSSPAWVEGDASAEVSRLMVSGFAEETQLTAVVEPAASRGGGAVFVRRWSAASPAAELSVGVSDWGVIEDIVPRGVAAGGPQWEVLTQVAPTPGELARVRLQWDDPALRWTLVGRARTLVTLPAIPDGLDPWRPPSEPGPHDAAASWVRHDGISDVGALRAAFGASIFGAELGAPSALEPILTLGTFEVRVTTCCTEP